MEMGYMNAKVGNDYIGFEEIMGKTGLGKMNQNGELFANFCASYDLVIGVPQEQKVSWTRNP